MKKILLISYYFPPSGSVGSPRMASWVKEFANWNLDTTVVTRHWSGMQSNWIHFTLDDTRPYEKKMVDGCPIHNLPYYSHQIPSWAKSTLTSKFYHLRNLLCGKFNMEINAYKTFFAFCQNLMATEKFDAILVSCPPFNLIPLASKLSRQFNVPFIVDFRDIWNNLLTTNDKDNRSLRLRFTNRVEEYYIGKWLKKCSHVTSVSPALVDQVKRIYSGSTGVITNGYEESIFKDIRSIEPSKEFFTFSSVGTIYPMQDLSIFIEGLKQFYPYVADAGDFRLNFIGIHAVEEVAARLKNELSMYNPLFTQRLSRDEVFKFYGQSHLLYKSAWATHKGMYSTKIFEYIGACRNILIAPNDRDVVEKLITETGLGHIANSVDEFVSILKKLYDEWKQNGNLHVNADIDIIKKYSREAQAKTLAESILALA